MVKKINDLLDDEKQDNKNSIFAIVDYALVIVFVGLVIYACNILLFGKLGL